MNAEFARSRTQLALFRQVLFQPIVVVPGVFALLMWLSIRAATGLPFILFSPLVEQDMSFHLLVWRTYRERGDEGDAGEF